MLTLRPFEFTSGSLSLDFVDTVAKRTETPIELLISPATLENWVKLAGMEFSSPPTFTPGALKQARRLREAIYRCILAVFDSSDLPEKDVALINRVASKPDLRPQLDKGAVTMMAQHPVDAVLARIAADAIYCVAPINHDRLRRCPDCKMVFQDNSRAKNRIWCSSSARCGNRAKVRRHRASQKQGKKT